MKKEEEKFHNVVLVLLLLTLLVAVYNSYQISNMQKGDFEENIIEVNTQLKSGIIPTGIPKIYGQELGVKYDDVSTNDPYNADLTIQKLGQIDRQITLEGKDNERYIQILYKKENGISCEYCCGARSIIFEDGKAACGCAHSFAMRGLAKYLITKHGSEYTDDEILEEVAKWKTLFFPTQMQQKAQIMESQGIEINYINIGSNKYRGIEKGSSGGGMVGGC